MKLSKYFNVSVDYLLGISPQIEIKENFLKPIYTDTDLKRQILDDLDCRNSVGLAYLAEYSDYLITRLKYQKEEMIKETKKK